MSGSPQDNDDCNHSSLQRATSLFEWLTDGDVRLVNTFMDEDIGLISTRDDWNTGYLSQIDSVISRSFFDGVDTDLEEQMDFFRCWSPT